MHRYSIDSLIGWFRDGAIWLVLAVAHLAALVTVPNTPPDWWYRWWSGSDWYYGSDNDWHPKRELAERFLLGTWRLLSEFIDESANYLVTQGFNVLSRAIGALPFWAQTVARGLDSLFSWIPNEIKYAGATWASLFLSVQMTVWDWARARFDDARTWTYTLRDWLGRWGNPIQAWWYPIQFSLDDFIRHPSERIKAVLGGTWTWIEALRVNLRGEVLAAFGGDLVKALALARDAGEWLYNFKATYAKDIGEFFADPGAWIVEKIRAEIERIW
jgi:hypothetical protein